MGLEGGRGRLSLVLLRGRGYRWAMVGVFEAGGHGIVTLVGRGWGRMVVLIVVKKG